jgi:SAM-dependent methyltransferase
VGHPRVTWRLDERAFAGPEHLDERYVAGYTAKSGLDPVEELELLKAYGLRSDAILVDLGAGTGVLARAAAPHCRRVIAVDASPAMARYLRASMPEGVQVVEAGFLTYRHEGEPASLVHSRNALHHLPDFWKGIALARIGDFIAADGVLVLRDLVYGFEPGESDARVEAWLADAAASPDAGWTRAELEEHVRSEHSTYSWLIEQLLVHSGFEIVDASVRRGVYATYVCKRR